MSLINELTANGYEVTAVCRPNSWRLASVPMHPMVSICHTELSELLSLSTALPHDYDVFFHFGWDGTYGNSRNDMFMQMQNVSYSMDAVRLASALGCKVFVGAGSQSEFGHVQGVLHPDLYCEPNNGYGAAKLSAYHMSRVLCAQLGIRQEWCRIVSLYGPFDGEHTMVMSTVLKMLRGERMQFTNGDQVWDYIYSKDAARAFRLTAEKGRHGSVYCLGTGKTKLLRDYISAIRDTVDPSLEIGLGELPYYPDQVMHLEADIHNLTKDTGFVPQYSFEEGIRETIDWARERYFHE